MHMTWEVRNASQPTSTAHPTERDATSFPRRSLFTKAAATTALSTLGGLALSACAPIVANETTNTLTTLPTTSLFHYSLEGATPQQYAGGMNKTATSANMAQLSGLSFSIVTIVNGPAFSYEPLPGRFRTIIFGHDRLIVPASR
jgi:hypothetical protein